MPMVWYVPPLSPVVDALRDTGHDAEDVGNLFGAIDTLRIPVEYLAELFTAGDTAPVAAVLQRLAAMRAYMRPVTLGEPPDESIAAAAGMTGGRGDRRCTGCWRSPSTTSATSSRRRYAEQRPALEETACSLDFDGGPGMLRGRRPFGEASGRPTPVAVETFHALQERQTAGEGRRRRPAAARVNLLNWDGDGARRVGSSRPGATRPAGV